MAVNIGTLSMAAFSRESHSVSARWFLTMIGFYT